MRLFCFLSVYFVCSILSTQQAFADLAKIKKNGEIKIGTSPGFFPFEMKSAKGQWVGFDVDMMNVFAKSLGVKATFVDVKWEGIIPGLMAGKYDAIAAGMTITEERKKAVLFSDPYFEATQAVMISVANKNRITKIEDLNNADYNICVKIGTTGDITAKKMFPKAKIKVYDDEADCSNSVVLKPNEIHAFMYDSPYVSLFVNKRQGKVSFLGSVPVTEHYGIALKQKDVDVATAFNGFLKNWRNSGEYAKANERNFVEMPWSVDFPGFLK